MTPLEITETMVRTGFAPRPADSHKGTYGHILSLCGSYGMSGAAYFAAKSALRCGAGLVTAAIPESIYPIVAAQLPEAVYCPLHEDLDHALIVEDSHSIVACLQKATSAVVGCGFGKCEKSMQLLKDFFEMRGSLPTVLDADGLNWLATLPEIPESILQADPLTLCVTPHPMEMARLLGTNVEVIQEDRVSCAETLAENLHAVVVLKGHRTIIAAEGFPTLINPTGCSGMSTGGTGDVLAGMIASFAAQGMSLYNAAIAGVSMHSDSRICCRYNKDCNDKGLRCS